MMRKDGMSLSNEAWIRRFKHPGMMARGIQHNRDSSLLQDQDVPDLTESLTKTLVHGNDRKGDSHGNETLDSLEEIDEDALALFLPDVDSASDTFPHNYVDIIGEQLDNMESLAGITNMATSCSSGVNACASGSNTGNETVQAFQQHMDTKPSILPNTSDAGLLPLRTINPKSSVVHLNPVQDVKVHHSSILDNIRQSSSNALENQSSQPCESIVSPHTEDHDNNNHCVNPVSSSSPCCDTLTLSEADSRCCVDNGPTHGTRSHNHPDHDLPNLDNVCNVSPDSGILSISESPESQDVASPCNPTTTHHPTLSPQSVFLDSVSPPRHVDYMHPEIDLADDNLGNHSDISDEPPSLIPTYNQSTLVVPVQRRGRGRPRKPLQNEVILTSPAKHDRSFDSGVSEEPPDVNSNRERNLPSGFGIKNQFETCAKPVTIPIAPVPQPKPRSPVVQRGTGSRSGKKIKDLLKLSEMERERALGHPVVTVGDFNQFPPKPKPSSGRKRKSVTVKALFAMVEEAKKSQKPLKKPLSIQKGYVSVEDCDVMEDVQVKKKVRKPVSSKVLASELKASTCSSESLPKAQKPKVPKIVKNLGEMCGTFRTDGNSLPVNRDLNVSKSLESRGSFVINDSKKDVILLPKVQVSQNAREQAGVVNYARQNEKLTCVNDVVLEPCVAKQIPLLNATQGPSQKPASENLQSLKQTEKSTPTCPSAKDSSNPSRNSDNYTNVKNRQTFQQLTSAPVMGSSTVNSSTFVNISGDASLKKKRGPGRPRKNPVESPANSNDSKEKVKAKPHDPTKKSVSSNLPAKSQPQRSATHPGPKSIESSKLSGNAQHKQVSPNAEPCKKSPAKTSSKDLLKHNAAPEVVTKSVRHRKMLSPVADVFQDISTKAPSKNAQHKLDVTPQTISGKVFIENTVQAKKSSEDIPRKEEISCKTSQPDQEKQHTSPKGAGKIPHERLVSKWSESDGPLSDSSRKSGEENFDSLIQKVKESIDSQFKGPSYESDNSQDPPPGSDTKVKEPSTTAKKQSENKLSEKKPKPKVYKPKIHVMMRRTKRRRRKKKVEKVADSPLSESLSVETNLGSAGTVEYEPDHENSVGLLMVAPSKSVTCEKTVTSQADSAKTSAIHVPSSASDSPVPSADTCGKTRKFVSRKIKELAPKKVTELSSKKECKHMKVNEPSPKKKVDELEFKKVDELKSKKECELDSKTGNELESKKIREFESKKVSEPTPKKVSQISPKKVCGVGPKEVGELAPKEISDPLPKKLGKHTPDVSVCEPTPKNGSQTSPKKVSVSKNTSEPTRKKVSEYRPRTAHDKVSEPTFGANSHISHDEKTEKLSKSLLSSPLASVPASPRVQLPPPCEKPHSKSAKKKKIKKFKSKHKNIIDPVFLEDVDEMSELLEKLVLDLQNDRALRSREDLPDIFRKQTYGSKKRKKEWLSIHKIQSKESRKLREEFKKGKERDKKTEKLKEKSDESDALKSACGGVSHALPEELGKTKAKKVEAKKRKRSISESEMKLQKDVVLSPVERTEHNEQCLPLKKRHKLFATAASEGHKKAEESPEKTPLLAPVVPLTPPVPVPLQPVKRKVGRPRKERPDSDAVAVIEPPKAVKQMIIPEKKTPGRRPKNIEKCGSTDKGSPEQTAAKPAVSETSDDVPESVKALKSKPGRKCKKKDVPTESEQKDGTNQGTNTEDSKSQSTSGASDNAPSSDQGGAVKKRSPGRPRKNFNGGKKGSGGDDRSPERPPKINKNSDPCISPERPQKNEEKAVDIVKKPVSEGAQVSLTDEGVQAESTQVSEGTQSEDTSCESKKLITSATQTCDDDFSGLLPVNRVEKDVQTCTSASQTQTSPVDDLGNSSAIPKFQSEFEQFLNRRSSVDCTNKTEKSSTDSAMETEPVETLVKSKPKDDCSSEKSTPEKSASEKSASKKSAPENSASEKSASKKSAPENSASEKLPSENSELERLGSEKVASKDTATEETASSGKKDSVGVVQSISPEKASDSVDSDIEVLSATCSPEKSSPKKSVETRRCNPNSVDPILEKFLKRSPEPVKDDSGCQECSKLQEADDRPSKRKRYQASESRLKSGAVATPNKVKFSGVSKGKGKKFKGKVGRKRKKPAPLSPILPPKKKRRGRKPKRRPGRPPKEKQIDNIPADKKVETPGAESSECSSESDYIEEHRVDSKSLTREYHPLPMPQRKRKGQKDMGDKVAKKKRRKHGDGAGKEPKKRYQKAGLFSDAYKEPSPAPSLKKSKPEDAPKDALVTKSKAAYNPEDHEHGLLPQPIHVGKYMYQKDVDFQLPHDIWFQHTTGLLRKNTRPAPNYRKIRNNVYIDMKPVCQYEPTPCTCIAPTVYNNLQFGCGEDCLNRLVYTECSPSVCASKDKCSNMRLQKHEWAPGLHLHFTGDRGYGVKCKYLIPNGQFIIEYVGEVVSEQEFKTRMTQSYSNERHHYCLDLDSGTVIDGYKMGSLCRFVNHSCEPNCEMQKWNVNGVYRIGLFALRDIQPNEELSYDYNFHNYNLEQQQECHCGSAKCRGTIGGRARRINGIGKEKNVKGDKQIPKDKRKSKSKLKKRNEKEEIPLPQYLQPMRPMSHRERCFILRHNIGLLRNLEKVRRIRQRMMKSTEEKKEEPDITRERSINQKDVFMSQFMALKTPRHIKTRRLTLAEEDSGVTRTAKLAQVLKDIFSAVAYCKDEDGNNIATPLMTLPPKKSHPAYYKVIKRLITLTSIEDKILSGEFSSPDPFVEEMMTLFENVEIYCGKKSDMGLKVKHLRKVFCRARLDASPTIEEIMGTGPSYSSNSEVDPSEADTESRHPEDEEDEEIIRCICGIYKDEGLMIQCEKCQVWQHCDCLRVNGDEEHYLCEECDPRVIDKEVPFTESDSSTPPEQTQYMTLFRDELLVRLGDSVYITKSKSEGEESPTRPPYKSVEDLNHDQLDIFRIERLWMDEKNEKFAYGHVYLRPQETFHEPSRKFFPNEVFRVPMYEIIPINVIVGTCHVLDLNTYCKGRPKGAKEEDIYICEYRLDKTAHVFYKISRSKYPVNTKLYCFDAFEKKLQPKRTFSPHTVPDNYKRKVSYSDTMSTTSADVEAIQMCRDDDNAFLEVERKSRKYAKESDTDSDEDLPLARVRDKKRQERKDRLNSILTKLLSSIPGKDPVDLTYLLHEGRGKRKKRPHPLTP